jgi:hypothetical protein
MHTLFYVLIRAFLWFIAVAIAIFPTLSAAPDAASMDPFVMFSTLNNVGAFRDVLFVIIPAAALAISTLIDYLCMCRTQMSGTAFGLSLIGVLMNITALVAGFVGFLYIEDKPHVPVNARFLLTYSWIICIAIGVGIITELAVSWSHGQIHLNPEEAV